MPSIAWAFVPHNYQGIYIHQMGHVFFFLSCLLVIVTILRNRLQGEKGWRYLFLSQIGFVLWNLDTFIGHVTEYWIESGQILGTTGGWNYFMRDIILEGREYVYYFAKLDHLVLVPSMLLFYAGLREHLHEEEKITPMMAVLPLLPLLAVDIGGSFLMIVLSILCLSTAVKLYRRNRENTLWNYLLWLSVAYVIFALSRAVGHILHHILTVLEYRRAWEYMEPFSGSLNTFTFVLIGCVSLFFSRVYEFYRELYANRKNIESVNTDLTELNHDLETLVAERTMSLMALTVADKVRNPASVIGWNCRRILESEGINEKVGGNLKDIIDEVKKLEKIVKDFEVLLKSKRSLFKYEDINEIVRSVSKIVEKDSVEKGVVLEFDLETQPLKINTQKNLMKAAIFHLFRNAIDATPRGGRIVIATAAEIDCVKLSVSDTGSGIPKEDIERIFAPFFSTKKFRFGMGLPLIKQIVSEHLGNISVESVEGKGTTFRLSFPARWFEQK
jgi:signal transduction histidine kinase